MDSLSRITSFMKSMKTLMGDSNRENIIKTSIKIQTSTRVKN